MIIFPGKIVIQKNQKINEDSSLEAENDDSSKRRMVLPFIPLSMSFDNVNYYVDMPLVSIYYFDFNFQLGTKRTLDTFNNITKTGNERTRGW